MRKRTGFTLIELILVIGIIALLVAVLLPTLNKARVQAQKAKCLSQLQQIGLACLNYAQSNDGWYPTSAPNEGGDVDCSNNFLILTTTDIYAIYRYETNPKRSYYLGPGLLILNGYLSYPQILYCPSWIPPAMQYGAVNGWPSNTAVPLPKPSGATEYDMSYNYRSSFEDDLSATPNNGSVNSGATPVKEWGYPPRTGHRYYELIKTNKTGGPLSPSQIAIMSDGFSEVQTLNNVAGVTVDHFNGYNVLYLDGHCAWYADDKGNIAALAQAADNFNKVSKMWNDRELTVWSALTPQ